MTIHPLFSTAGIEQGVERQMFGALVRINDKLEPVPDLAEKIEISADAKIYTFTLKKGLIFSDGKPLTSADVVFTIQRAVDKRTGSYWRGRLLAIDGAADYGDQKADTIKGLEAPDDNTIKMTLTVPDSTWLITIGDFAGLSILPKHILESTPPDQMAKAPFAFAPTPSGGAFVFADWKADQYLADQAQRDLHRRAEGETGHDLLQGDHAAGRRPRATRLGRGGPDGRSAGQRGRPTAQEPEPDGRSARPRRASTFLAFNFGRDNASRTSACGRR